MSISQNIPKLEFEVMNWMLLSEAASNAKQWEYIMADPDVILIDIDDPTTYSVSHVFSTDDITVTFAGDTIGSLADPLLGLDTTGLNGTKTAKDNNTTLYPINSDFGFIVTDFDGAEQKDFFENPEYLEGWAGNLLDDSQQQAGIVISIPRQKLSRRQHFWARGLRVWAEIPSRHRPSTMSLCKMSCHITDLDDPDAAYPLDNDLKVIGGDYDG